jgi:predicted Holliday junction resolvase-like endonuclease
MVLLIPLDILIPITLIIIILIVLMWILYSKNRELKSKLISEKKRFSMYKQQIENLMNSGQNPTKIFEKLNEIVRNFFKDYFELKFSLTYLELEEFFRKQNKEDYASLCKLMSDINYSGEKANEEQIEKVVKMFYGILKSYE